MIEQAARLIEKLFTVPEMQGIVIAENFRSPRMIQLLKNSDLAWKVSMFSRCKSRRNKSENLAVIRQVLTYYCESQL